MKNHSNVILDLKTAGYRIVCSRFQLCKDKNVHICTHVHGKRAERNRHINSGYILDSGLLFIITIFHNKHMFVTLIMGWRDRINQVENQTTKKQKNINIYSISRLREVFRFNRKRQEKKHTGKEQFV